LPTIFAAAGVPEVKEKLLIGYKKPGIKHLKLIWTVII